MYANKGQSLIEVIIAIVVASLSIPAIISLGNMSIKNSTIINKQLEADKLARAGIESVTYVRDACYGELKPNTCYKMGSTICSAIDIIGTVGGCSTIPSINQWENVILNSKNYRRITQVTQESTGLLKVVTKVSWDTTSSNESTQVSLSTLLSEE